MLDDSSILITGGTGSFGKEFIRNILRTSRPRRVIVYSRDEWKQSEMQADPEFQDKSVRFFLGDVRDKDRLCLAMRDVDYVIHAAALKQVPAAEYNPHEFIKTNVNGATNIVEAAIEAKVKRVVALSTDKAVNPVNLYGATKLCSDKVFIAANSYAGVGGTTFSVVRYGNVVGSRGSVIPLFQKQRESGSITITNPDMTRFLITLQQGVDFVLSSLKNMVGGELFVPKIPACTVSDLANVLAPDCEKNIIGLRPGEKMHEILIPSDEARNVLEFDDHFVIQPVQAFWGNKIGILGGVSCSEGFHYASNQNCEFLSIEELTDLLADYLPK
ncbi:MAG: UDP-N-acetylglucosamine 4,6-dehydratase (inverting) [Opitutae bacterium]|nr:UDP-N-acetylglucosamine 4,6-dehydratase (inverting) [Verrucomicrobiota bacterium]MDA0904836.1 UDP-N-acetylglucosamine 4,6-dehydratase (inverting) [Verrucomicrobiota bacterium]MDA1078475.1 UDP-N-acetylglucosamine 4,6-dehydratase (inverting) [Verrucomicrobiota bacterium]NDH00301.1 UDP-N-acetylglucosamine 4,6-dehydratase (inverting) [Opitutae bacterium]